MPSAEERSPVVRPAARLVLLDDLDRILLVRFEDSSRQVSWWATPGGALKPGEGHEEALRREILEETGHRLQDPGPWIWTREHVVRLAGESYRQQERFYLNRTDAFEPVALGLEPDEVTYFRRMRWWTLTELEATGDELSPRALPLLIRRLVEDGPPLEPPTVGI